MEPIKSDILVDPKMAKEIMHRWNTWEQMLEALKAIHTESSNTYRMPSLPQVADAILNAETRE